MASTHTAAHIYIHIYIVLEVLDPVQILGRVLADVLHRQAFGICNSRERSPMGWDKLHLVSIKGIPGFSGRLETNA